MAKKTKEEDVRGSDVKQCFNEKERGKVRKDYTEKIMNEDNDCDHKVEGDAVEAFKKFCMKKM